MDREFVGKQGALDPYEEFLRDRPEEAARVTRLVNEGRALLEKGDADEARARFIRAIAIFPHVPAALTNLAALALHQENPDQAWHYLTQILEHFPSDPAGHAVAIRYWLQRGSHPKAYFHGERAVRGLQAMLERAPELLDPTLIDRARVILLSILSTFEADSLITRVRSLCEDRPWDAAANVTFGIAYYNQGEFALARQAWAKSEGMGPADLYMFFLDLIDADEVVPFRLDYQTNAKLPSLEELRHALDIEPRDRNPLRLVQADDSDASDQEGGSEAEGSVSAEEAALIQALRFAVVRDIPSVAALEGLHYIWHGSDEEAETAFSILFFERWPHLPHTLNAVVQNERLSMRIRLNGALYMLWTTGEAAARRALEHLEAQPMQELEQLLASIIWMQIALVTEDVPLGQTSEVKARELASTVSADVEAWVAVLNELSLRLQKMAESAGIQTSSHEARQTRKSGEAINKIIPFPTGRLARRLREQDDS